MKTFVPDKETAIGLAILLAVVTAGLFSFIPGTGATGSLSLNPWERQSGELRPGLQEDNKTDSRINEFRAGFSAGFGLRNEK